MQILLKDILLFGYHGVHPLENKVGTNFKIDLTLDVRDVVVKNIEDTIDYEKVYLLLKNEFGTTEQLLEVLAERIIEKISATFNGILQIELTIIKINPPIPSFEGMVGVKKSKKLN
jgi:dihydroneopterin aldolase